MYLRIFEDLSMAQSDKEPDEQDRMAVAEGILDVICFIGGSFTRMESDGSFKHVDMEKEISSD